MPEWLPSRLQNRWSEACGSGRIRINQQTPSAVTTNVCALWSCGRFGGSSPSLLSFGSDSGSFASLGCEQFG